MIINLTAVICGGAGGKFIKMDREVLLCLVCGIPDSGIPKRVADKLDGLVFCDAEINWNYYARECVDKLTDAELEEIWCDYIESLRGNNDTGPDSKT